MFVSFYSTRVRWTYVWSSIFPEVKFQGRPRGGLNFRLESVENSTTYSIENMRKLSEPETMTRQTDSSIICREPGSYG